MVGFVASHHKLTRQAYVSVSTGNIGRYFKSRGSLKRPAKNLTHGFSAGRAKHIDVALRSPFSLSQVKGRTL
ncbi:MAG: hypothetical protein CSA70_08315 [Rhodobacterales bacterium]|nr:MAG: hypothetical protein CSA70_08315 [Rhodobacterales bacterium]